jgi:hypothetical protein
LFSIERRKIGLREKIGKIRLALRSATAEEMLIRMNVLTILFAIYKKIFSTYTPSSPQFPRDTNIIAKTSAALSFLSKNAPIEVCQAHLSFRQQKCLMVNFDPY